MDNLAKRCTGRSRNITQAGNEDALCDGMSHTEKFLHDDPTGCRASSQESEPPGRQSRHQTLIYTDVRSTVILLVIMFSFNQKEVISQSSESQSMHAGMLTWQRRLAEVQSQHQNGGKLLTKWDTSTLAQPLGSQEEKLSSEQLVHGVRGQRSDWLGTKWR